MTFVSVISFPIGSNQYEPWHNVKETPPGDVAQQLVPEDVLCVFPSPFSTGPQSALTKSYTFITMYLQVTW